MGACGRVVSFRVMKAKEKWRKKYGDNVGVSGCSLGWMGRETVRRDRKVANRTSEKEVALGKRRPCQKAADVTGGRILLECAREDDKTGRDFNPFYVIVCLCACQGANRPLRYGHMHASGDTDRDRAILRG